MKSSSDKARTIYKLGLIEFTVAHEDDQFIQDLEILLPKQNDEQATDVIEVPSQAVHDLRSLQNYVLAMHENLLWFDAGCLITPNGKRVLIAGRSSAGKSTTTMALALAYNWKVIAEDILLIDTSQDRLITFGAPFSLKPGTADLLQDCIGMIPDPILDDEWSPMGDLGSYGPNDAKFDIAIIFGDRTLGKPVEVRSVTPAEYLRKILAISNLLRVDGATEKFLEYINSCHCVEIDNGTLRERLNVMLELQK